MARARPGTRQVRVKMTLMVPKHPDIDNEYLSRYISEAVRHWNGQYEPPNSQNNYEGDPMFGAMREPGDLVIKIGDTTYMEVTAQEGGITIIDDQGQAQVIKIEGL